MLNSFDWRRGYAQFYEVYILSREEISHIDKQSLQNGNGIQSKNIHIIYHISVFVGPRQTYLQKKWYELPTSGWMSWRIDVATALRL